MGDSRKYPLGDVKILWGLAAARCSFPQCRLICIAEKTEKDQAKSLGRIAHIYAHSDTGPRANPNLTPEQRDRYENWLLLCADHHDRIDKQENSYTADELLDWKAEHEAWVNERLAEEVTSVSFAELEIVTQAIIASPINCEIDFDLTPLKQKINKNNLSPRIANRITTGLIKTGEVADFLSEVSKRIPDFSDKVTQGFINAYNERFDSGISGDALFEDLHIFSSGGSSDFDKLSAGLAVLVYLFEKCEVFEK